MKTTALTAARALAALIQNVWDHVFVAACCTLAMASGCVTGSSIEGAGGTGGSYGPLSYYTCSDEQCSAQHDGGNWYCEHTADWPYCVQVADEDAGSAKDAAVKPDGSEGE
jgi:hypothetical protein